MSEAKKPTARELIETATAIDYRTCSLDQMWDEVSLLVRHVLDTVREDDDEPVTREWFQETGAFPEQEDRDNDCVRVFIHNTGSQFVYADRHRGKWSIMIGNIRLCDGPRRGEFRSLMKVLRVDFKG